MEFHHCPACMEEWNGKGVCPNCGFHVHNAEANPDCLPLEMILSGRYVSGKPFKRDTQGATYIGWDLNLNQKVAILEYFPKTMVSRRNEKGQSRIVPNPGQEIPFQKGRDGFIHDARTKTRLQKHPRVGRTTDLFLQNGTVYAVMDYVTRENAIKTTTEMVGATVRMMEKDVPLEVMMGEKETAKTVADILLPKLGEKDVSVEAMAQLAGLSRACGYKLLKNQMNPGQDTLLRLAFVLELDPEETQELLKSGHCAMLTASRLRDRAIIYGLKNRLSLGEMDAVLEKFALHPLVPPEKKK